MIWFNVTSCRYRSFSLRGQYLTKSLKIDLHNEVWQENDLITEFLNCFPQSPSLSFIIRFIHTHTKTINRWYHGQNCKCTPVNLYQPFCCSETTTVCLYFSHVFLFSCFGYVCMRDPKWTVAELLMQENWLVWVNKHRNCNTAWSKLNCENDSLTLVDVM